MPRESALRATLEELGQDDEELAQFIHALRECVEGEYGELINDFLNINGGGTNPEDRCMACATGAEVGISWFFHTPGSGIFLWTS